MRAGLVALALVLLAPGAEAASYTVHVGTRADGSMYMTPERLSVEKGEKVALTVVNDDPSTPHDWALLSFGARDIEAYVKGGESKTITFTADTAGTFRVVCQVVGHKQKGMEGEFVVENKLLPGPGPAALALALALAAALVRRR